MSKLARLYLGNNSIVSLDEYSLLCGELSLVELDMQGNHISDIPPDIGRLSKLKALNVANNDLTDVPYTLGYMGSLQRSGHNRIPKYVLCFLVNIILLTNFYEEYNWMVIQSARFDGHC